jgi:hypothetical protein
MLKFVKVELINNDIKQAPGLALGALPERRITD